MLQEHKTLNSEKRLAAENIIGLSRALHTINLNREDANLELFKRIVTEIAINANELILLANSITNDQEN